LQHLRKPGGIIAVNVANRFINLLPVLRAHARRDGLDMTVIFSGSDEFRALRCRWVLLSPNHEIFNREPFASRSEKEKTGGREVEWSDGFSNVFELLL
jgi:hypothetical protein